MAKKRPKKKTAYKDKPKAKKKTFDAASFVKSLFLYGRPNKGKKDLLTRIQDEFTDAVNLYITDLCDSTGMEKEILLGSEKSPALRVYEKKIRIYGLYSAYSQSAFDQAVVYASQYEQYIWEKVLSVSGSLLVLSKAAYCACLDPSVKKEDVLSLMAELLENAKDGTAEFYRKVIAYTEKLSDEDFEWEAAEIRFLRKQEKDVKKIPHVNRASVRLDSRLASVTEGKCRAQYCVEILDTYIREGEKKRQKVVIPLNTSSETVNRIKKYGMKRSWLFSVIKDGVLKVSGSFEKKIQYRDTVETKGLDTGIIDIIHTSDNKAIGSFTGNLVFYKMAVEPALGEVSKLRNKLAKLKKYIREHDLPEEVEKELRAKAGRLDSMIRTEKRSKRLLDQYHAGLRKKCKDTSRSYMDSIDKETLTAIELLDIRDTKGGTMQDGKLSLFARAQFQDCLKDILRSNGYRVVEVDPEYTSKTCPRCFNIDIKNRDHKEFKCTCCGYSADADYVGGQNIRYRAVDEDYKKMAGKVMTKREKDKAILDFFKKKHDGYMKTHSAGTEAMA